MTVVFGPLPFPRPLSDSALAISSFPPPFTLIGSELLPLSALFPPCCNLFGAPALSPLDPNLFGAPSLFSLFSLTLPKALALGSGIGDGG